MAENSVNATPHQTIVYAGSPNGGGGGGAGELVAILLLFLVFLCAPIAILYFKPCMLYKHVPEVHDFILKLTNKHLDLGDTLKTCKDSKLSVYSKYDGRVEIASFGEELEVKDDITNEKDCLYSCEDKADCVACHHSESKCTLYKLELDETDPLSDYIPHKGVVTEKDGSRPDKFFIRQEFQPKIPEGMLRSSRPHKITAESDVYEWKTSDCDGDGFIGYDPLKKCVAVSEEVTHEEDLDSDFYHFTTST